MTEARGPIDPDELVDLDEIALKAGVPREAAHKWTMRDDFPIPLFPRPGRTFAGRSRIWYWPDVEAWFRTTPVSFRSAGAKELARRPSPRAPGASH